MLKGLFKPAWQSDSADKRLGAIAKMDASRQDLQTELLNLASDDVERAVRIAAINKLTAPVDVFDLSQNHHDEQTCLAAEKAFCRLIGANSQLNEMAFRELLEQPVFKQQNKARLLLAEHCPISSVRHEILQELSEAELAELIGEVDYAATRKLIAEQLSVLENLELARKKLVGKDKTAEKIIRSKIDTIREAEKLDQANNLIAEQLCEKMEFIANHNQWRSEFKSRYEQTQKHWNSLDFTPQEQFAQRFAQATDKAALEVEKQNRIESAKARQLNVVANLKKSSQAIADLELDALIEYAPKINADLATNLADWLQSNEVVTATPKLAEEFINVQRCLASVSEFCALAHDVENTSSYEAGLKAIDWPKEYPSLVAKTQAQDLLEETKKNIKQSDKQYKDNVDKLHKRINRLLGTTKKGDLRRAKNELSALSKAVEHYSGRDRKVLDERLEQASEVVTKMVDWQNFATEPKLIELCEAMEALVNAQMHPDKRAQEISTLQKQWKNIAYADVADLHWDRFKAAGDLAYEPCAVFFAERREKQAKNLAEREPLITQMQFLLDNTDWNQDTNYKDVETKLREIQNKWQKIKDVERGAGQKQWKRLSKIREAVYAKLDLEYDANIDRKQKIINQLETLLDADISDDTLAKLQLAQTRWKQVGVTRRKQDQAAWKKFKSVSDAVYEKIQGKRKAIRAEEDQQLDAYRNIIKSINGLAKSTSNLAQSDPEFEQLKADYQSLPAMPKGLPEKLIERIAGDFDRAQETYSKAREVLIQSAKNAVLQNLAEKAQKCTEIEAAVETESADKIQSMLDELSTIEISDKNLEKRFSKRLAQVRNTDRKQANEERKMLCIDLEILLDITSPEQDRDLRTKIQLDRMKQQGLIHSPEQEQQKIKELKIDWYCLPGAEPKLQRELQKRFESFTFDTLK